MASFASVIGCIFDLNAGLKNELQSGKKTR